HMAAEMGISNLSDLAMGGYHMAYGAKVGQDSRMAISFAQTPIGFYAGNPAFGAASGNSPTANYTMGFSSKLRDDLTAGVSFSMLDETSGLLGSSYSSNSAMGLGGNRTGQFGVSLAYAFDDHNSLLFEAGEAVTKAAEGTGLLAGTTTLRSRSYGVTYMARQLVNAEDRLAVSLKQPLRVASGQVGVVTPSIDADTGVARYGVEMVSLVPSGRELDFKMNYSTPINKVQSLSFQLGARKDVFNISGNNDFAAGATWTAAF
ncbi:MAG: hypothetical protein RKP46_00040, partial [Candidatus Accumulibacter sp.]|uniref:hypothetical protein n=1 Tax=Accumulibacter sp. TaxID=2053492 RepID=UPI0028795058